MKTVIENLLAEYDMINSAFAKDLREALAEQPAQQQPVLWQILNGVCHAGVRSTENLAKEAATGMQKNHDLGGSLAAFHVRPLYTSPPASKPWVGLTDEDIKEAEWLLSAIKEHEAYTLQEQLLVEGVDVFARAIEAKLREKNA